ncbi:hypothetical protein BC833DRAFT_618213 [Globomyces pollinis-pini]|nr:hypothetical protein BC833DRAFT_618213 [Globomyces pollinis-pini]
MTEMDPINKELNSILSNFSHAIQTVAMSKNNITKSKLDLNHDHLLLNRANANILRSVESLLAITFNLKHSLLLNDTVNINHQLLARKSALVKQSNITRQTLIDCSTELLEIQNDIMDCL